MSIQGIGANLVNGGVALGTYIKAAATVVGEVALKILSNLPWVEGVAGSLPAWALGSISVGVGLTALTGLALVIKYAVTNYVIPYFAAKNDSVVEVPKK